MTHVPGIHEHPLTVALRLVADHKIEWRATVGLSGGFADLSGRAPEPTTLVELCRARQLGLITVDTESGRVSTTLSGAHKLTRAVAGARIARAAIEAREDKGP